MLTQVVSIGDKIDLWKIDNNEKNYDKTTYKSQILDFIDKDNLRILMPFDGTKVVPLEVETKYTLCIYTKKGLYSCRSIVKNRYRQDNLLILDIQIISELEKYQRREYYRLECLIEVEYRIITDNEITLRKKLKENSFVNEEELNICLDNLKTLEKQWIEGTIIDISGGGARLNSETNHESNQQIELRVPFDLSKNYKEIKLKANVVFSLKLQNRIGFYEHRIQFSEISKEKRETIIKYIFDEERRIRRKEKGLD